MNPQDEFIWLMNKLKSPSSSKTHTLKSDDEDEKSIERNSDEKLLRMIK